LEASFLTKLLTFVILETRLKNLRGQYILSKLLFMSETTHNIESPTVLAAEHEVPHFTHSEIVVIISALMLAMLIASLDQTIVATALPQTIMGGRRLPSNQCCLDAAIRQN
jgi:hypothetical protein